METESASQESRKDDEVSKEHSREDDQGSREPYNCAFCRRGFLTAQALGGHMNVHRKHRGRGSAAAAPSTAAAVQGRSSGCYGETTPSSTATTADGESLSFFHAAESVAAEPKKELRLFIGREDDDVQEEDEDRPAQDDDVQEEDRYQSKDGDQEGLLDLELRLGAGSS